MRPVVHSGLEHLMSRSPALPTVTYRQDGIKDAATRGFIG